MYSCKEILHRFAVQKVFKRQNMHLLLPNFLFMKGHKRMFGRVSKREILSSSHSARCTVYGTVYKVEGQVHQKKSFIQLKKLGNSADFLYFLCFFLSVHIFLNGFQQYSLY